MDFVLLQIAFATELALNSFKFRKYVHWTDRQTDRQKDVLFFLGWQKKTPRRYKY